MDVKELVPDVETYFSGGYEIPDLIEDVEAQTDKLRKAVEDMIDSAKFMDYMHRKYGNSILHEDEVADKIEKIESITGKSWEEMQG